MQQNLKQQVLSAFQLVMRPVVKILFRYGIGYNEFAEVCKTAFVDVATTEFGIRGRPTNTSRVAVMTGLTRKEVRRLRNKIDSGDQSISVKTTPAAEIIHRWHAEDDFLDEHGRPAALKYSGVENSFSELVRRFGGDVPPGAMRTELKRVGSVEEGDDGLLTIVRRSLISADRTEALVTSLVHSLYPLVSTLHANSNPDESRVPHGQFAAYSVNIDVKDLKRLRRVSYDRLSDMAESFDDLFMAYETLHDAQDDARKTTVAVGFYYFEENDPNAKYTW